MTQYLFDGAWYTIDHEDTATLYRFARAVFDADMLTQDFRDFVDESYACPHDLVDDMVDCGAQPILDNIIALFLDWCVDNFDDFVGYIAEEVKE